MKKTGIALSVLLLTGLLAGALHATAPRPDPGFLGDAPGLRERIPEAMIRMNLSDSQEHDIALVLKRHRDEVKTVARNLMQARKHLFDLVIADEYSEDAVRQASRDAAAYAEQLAVLRAGIFHDIHKVLTPEQRQIVQQLKSELPRKVGEKIHSRATLVDQWIEVHSR
jgi:Spy/CpxP family protein refolding chaperone